MRINLPSCKIDIFTPEDATMSEEIYTLIEYHKIIENNAIFRTRQDEREEFTREKMRMKENEELLRKRKDKHIKFLKGKYNDLIEEKKRVVKSLKEKRDHFKKLSNWETEKDKLVYSEIVARELQFLCENILRELASKKETG